MAVIWNRKQKLRNQLLVIGIIVMGMYLLYNNYGEDDESGGNENNGDVEEETQEDLDALEKELENRKKVERVTYQPPKVDLLAWASGIKHGKDEFKESEAKRAMRYHKIWSYANSVTDVHTLWHDTPDIETVLSALQLARIVYVDMLDPDDEDNGTANKWVVYLEGGQKAMMKIIWEPKIKGKMKKKRYCNYGYEMPWSEIAAFHLHRVLGFHNTPYVTGRVVDIKNEILPVASPAVSKMFSMNGTKTCVTGKCHFCKRSLTICPGNGLVEASVAYWVPQKLHLWTKPIKYMPYSTPRQEEWGKYGFNNKTYCNKLLSVPPYDTLRYFHDLFDFAVIDTLMYHYDSKHYIIEDDKSEASGLTVRLDHGRAFCAYDEDNIDVFLAPLNQCCILRRDTYWTIKEYIRQPGLLTDRLKRAFANDPIAPLLQEVWFEALERRLKLINLMADKCAKAVGLEEMLVG